MDLIERARMLRPFIEKAAESLSDEDGLNAIELFPHWSGDDVSYEVNTRVQYNSLLYKCLQSHTSQPAWNPIDASSLWVRVDDPTEEWPEWRQPLGSTDAYPAGYKVSHNGKHWISDVDNNTWEPGVYGWTEQV